MSPGRRRNGAGVPRPAGLERRPPEDHLALELGEHRRSAGQPFVQLLVELRARDQIGKQQRRRRRGQLDVLERAAQRLGRATARHEHGTGARVGDSAGPLGDGVVHRAQVRHPHEAGDAWGYHRFRGSDVCLSSSWAARSSSMSAPAAADAASHASFMSLDDTAFRRVETARRAI